MEYPPLVRAESSHPGPLGFQPVRAVSARAGAAPGRHGGPQGRGRLGGDRRTGRGLQRFVGDFVREDFFVGLVEGEVDGDVLHGNDPFDRR
jgi:hypothetical protein